MRWLFAFVGFLLALVGIVWTLQGINVVSYGFMAGHFEFTMLGLVLSLGGIALMIFAVAREEGDSAAHSDDY